MGILDSIKSVFSSSSEGVKTSEVTPLNATKAFDITISGVKAGSTYAEVKAQAEGAEAVSQNVDITVTEKPVTYTKYTFQIENIYNSAYQCGISSKAFQDMSGDMAFGGEFTGGSSEQIEYLPSCAAPTWEFDQTKFLELMYEDIKDLEIAEPFVSMTELGEVTNIGDNVNTFLYYWLASQTQYAYGIRCDSTDVLELTGTLLSKEIVEIKPSQAIDSLTINKVVVDTTNYPDLANYVGCWSFDADKNAIEGVIYKEVVSS